LGKTFVLVAEAEKEVKALAIAPGGNIVQHIEPDTNESRIWDVANSKILNIQLIDARTFKLVTNMDPPETPITPNTYKELGLPFYQLQREHGAHQGVAGKWTPMQGAKSVAAAILDSTTKVQSQGGSGVWAQGSTSGETGNWGLLSSGAWGDLNDENPVTPEDGSELEEEDNAFRDPSFNFPIILLDVDESIPRFKSILEEEDEDWNDEEDLYE
jgi:hypothetical protein